MRGGKLRGYEGAHRVPLFIRWASEGIGGGRDVDQLTAHIDILAHHHIIKPSYPLLGICNSVDR